MSPDAGQTVFFERPAASAQLRQCFADVDTQIDLSKLQADTLFTEAGADSLDCFNMLTAVPRATGVDIADKDIGRVNTFAGLAAYLNAAIN